MFVIWYIEVIDCLTIRVKKSIKYFHAGCTENETENLKINNLNQEAFLSRKNTSIKWLLLTNFINCFPFHSFVTLDHVIFDSKVHLQWTVKQ